MTDNTDKLMAEALVECGFISEYHEPNPDNYYVSMRESYTYIVGLALYEINPFADTLESRRQADALEDWLYYNIYDLWTQSMAIKQQSDNFHQWRLDRIKYCFEQLAEKS